MECWKVGFYQQDATVLLYMLSSLRLLFWVFSNFPVSPFSRPISDFYADIPALYSGIPCYLVFYMEYRAWCASGGWERGGSHGWSVGVPGLVNVLNRLGSLTCQPDSRLRIPVWLPSQQGTGEPSSADHSWPGSYCSFRSEWTIRMLIKSYFSTLHQ